MAKNKKNNYYIAEDEELIKKRLKDNIGTIIIDDDTDITGFLKAELYNTESFINLYDLGTHKPAEDEEKQKFLESIGIKKGTIISDSILDEYLELLEQRASEDISNTNIDEILDLIKLNNVAFFQYYATKIQPNLFDLYDESAQDSYAFKTFSYLMSLQLSEIERIGYDTFSNLNLNDSDSDFTKCFSIKTLKEMQKDIKKSYITDEEKSEEQKNLLFINIMPIETERIKNSIKKDVEKNKTFYEERHKKYERLKELLVIIKDKYENRLNEIRDKNTNIDTEKYLYKNEITTNFQLIDNRLQKNLSLIESNIEQPIDMKLSKKKHNVIESTPINVWLDIADSSVYGTSLDPFDVMIWNTAFNLREAKNEHLTPELIYKEITGKTPNNMGKELYNNIMKSIIKLSITRIKFTYSKSFTEALHLDKETIERLSITEYALPLREIEIEYTNHTKKTAFVYISEPIYFQLSRIIKQIKTIDRKLLALDTGGSINTNRLIIRYQLAIEYERIKSLKGTDKENCKIAYDTFFNKSEVFKEIDKEIANTTDSKIIAKLKDKRKTYRKRYLQEIKDILEVWIKNKDIKSYEEYPADTRQKKGIKLNF